MATASAVGKLRARKQGIPLEDVERLVNNCRAEGSADATGRDKEDSPLSERLALIHLALCARVSSDRQDVDLSVAARLNWRACRLTTSWMKCVGGVLGQAALSTNYAKTWRCWA